MAIPDIYKPNGSRQQIQFKSVPTDSGSVGYQDSAGNVWNEREGGETMWNVSDFQKNNPTGTIVGYNPSYAADLNDTTTPRSGSPTAQPVQAQTTGMPTLANGQQAGGLAMPPGYSASSPGQQGLATAQASGVPPPQTSGEASSGVQKFMPGLQAPTFYKPTTPVAGFDPQTLFDSTGKPVSYDQYIAAGGKPDFSNVQVGSPPTQQSGGKPSGVFSSPTVDMQLAEDKGYQALLKTQAEFNNFANQNKSLTESYKEISKELGIDQINTELLNAKNIIEGSEDDIRTEITKAGGFATESQVMAMTNARNKQMIKNYNNLLATKQMALETLNTMTNLMGQDRQFAMNTIQQKLQIDQQIIEYQQRMTDNARQTYNNIVDQVGYAGLQQMTGGDPYYTSLVEKTLGLGSGGLAQLAVYKKPLSEAEQLDLDTKKFALSQAKAEAPLDLQLKKAQIAAANRSNQGSREIPTAVVDVNGKKLLINSKTGETIREIGGGATGAGQLQVAQSKANIDLISGLTKDSNLKSAVGPNPLARFSTTNFFTGGKSNFVAGVQQLGSQLTLDSLINAKARGATFGALSEGELNVLAASASKIGTWAIKDKSGNVIGYDTNEKNFRTELDKINNFAKLDYILKGGNPADVNVQTMPDGTHWTQNSDGSMTQL